MTKDQKKAYKKGCAAARRFLESSVIEENPYEGDLAYYWAAGHSDTLENE